MGNGDNGFNGQGSYGSQFPPQGPPNPPQGPPNDRPFYGSYPPPKPTRRWFQKKRYIFLLIGLGLLVIPGGLIVVLFVGYLLFGSSSSEAEPVVVSSVSGAPPADDGAGAISIGTVFTADDFEYTLTGYECGIPSVGGEFSPEVATGQYCRIALSAKNVGNEAADLNYRDFRLVEGEALYSTESWVNIRGNGDGESTGFLDEINPGLTVTGGIYFDVPADLIPSRAVLSESWLADDIYVELSQ